LLSTIVNTGSMKNFETRILGVCCNWAAHSSINQGNITEVQYSIDICLLLPTRCGIVQPDSILEAFAQNANGLLTASCSDYYKAYLHHTGDMMPYARLIH